ncbi:MAG: XkdQ/YqbQ family protein [Fusobacteriaceae bacterium]
MHQIKLIQGKESVDITQFTNGINLTTSLDTLGASFSFNIARDYYNSQFSITETIKTGDLIKFENEDKNLFTGIIVDITKNKFSKDIKCLDFYFYLNKNKVIKQFDVVDATSCITNLLKMINAKIGKVEKIATAIEKIYKNKTVAEIITDILDTVKEETGKKYIIEITGTTFNLVLYKKLNLKIYQSNFGTPSVTESISEMKNKILVISNDQEEMSICAEAKDEKNIKKYGMLQEILEVDPDKDDMSKVRNIAVNKLKELNKVLEKASIEVIATDDLRAGRILEVDVEEFGLKGNYLIKSCTHSISKGYHKANLELEMEV